MVEFSSLVAALLKCVLSYVVPSSSISHGIDAANALTAMLVTRRERRNFDLQVQTIQARLEDAFESSIPVEFSNLSSNDYNVALELATSAFESAAQRRDELLKYATDATALARQLTRKQRQQWSKSGLSEAGERLLHQLVERASSYLTALVRSLPEIRDERDWAAYIALNQLPQTVETTLNSVILPHYRNAEPGELASFDVRYRTAVIEDSQNLEILGLSVPPELRRQSIDEAYVELGATVEQSDHLPSGKSMAVRSIVADLETAAKHVGTRLLIVGQAGSGKTTFLQWLAYRCASGTLPRSLAPLVHHSPFHVKLRYLFYRGRRPSLADVVRRIYTTSEPPGGWVNTRLRSGWLLLDGFDELRQSDQSAAYAWVSTVLKEQPSVRCIATSRPDGFDRSWFERNGFTVCTLNPLEPAQVVECVNSWYSAAYRTVLPINQPQLSRSRDELVRHLDEQPPLRDLCATPLLAALLCAFYANGLSGDPRNRTSLYSEVCNMLVTKRERGKEIRSDSDFSGNVRSEDFGHTSDRGRYGRSTIADHISRRAQV